MPTERRTHRVVKTLAPTNRGAITWTRHYGEALVCVRHRTDAKGKFRHTTVELLVETTPIRPRNQTMVQLRTGPHERELIAVIKTAGGKWDAKARLWTLPRRVAGILSLHDRIVQQPPSG